MRRKLRTLRERAVAATLGAALSTIPAISAHAEDRTQTARAVITIPAPKSTYLLQLRGIGGRGTALLQDGGACHSMPVRLVAGDFYGQQTNLRGREPIVLEIRNPELVQALLSGRDIVSDEAIVSADPTDHKAGILLLSELNEGTGFVINPGRNIASDFFGALRTDISCNVFSRTQTVTEEG